MPEQSLQTATEHPPTLRFHDMCSRCIETVETAHRRKLESAYCLSCGSTLSLIRGGWEVTKRGPMANQEARTSEAV